MTTKTIHSSEIKWYLSYEILCFEYEKKKDTQEEILVWENLILIQANDPERAYLKAVNHGRLSEEKLLINDKKGLCKFKGIKKLVPIYEELSDGSEIEWREYEFTKDKLRKMIPPKKKLQAFQPLTDFEEV